MDISERLDELVAMVESARSMPMSASCIVNRTEMLDALESLRGSLPDELTVAREVLDDRSAVVEQGRAEAQRIIDEAVAERNVLVSRTEVVKEAAIEAERLIEGARVEGDQMRQEVDGYVDAKLANFEIILTRTLDAVAHGRDKISGRHDELADLAGSTDVAEPLPS